jgi:hypothetical protein
MGTPFSYFKVASFNGRSAGVSPALIGAFAQSRCRQDARRYRLQSFKFAKFKSAKRQASI